MLRNISVTYTHCWNALYIIFSPVLVVVDLSDAPWDRNRGTSDTNFFIWFYA